MKSNILVIGGTGKTGRKVVEKLQKLNHNVRVGSRNANPAFDWENPMGWAAALEGMEKVYITFQPDLAVPGALESIEELVKIAAEKEVKKLVLLSGKGEREAELCEQIVIHSGLDYTIIRASWFMENFSESFFLDPILAGHVALPKAEAKVPYVSTDDISDVAIEALIDHKHNGEIYELTGSKLFVFEEVIEMISKASKRDIQFTPISVMAYSKMMEDLGVPSDYIWLVNYLFTEVIAGKGNDIITNDVENILGRKPKKLSDYIQESVLTGVWNPIN
jgi:uncharacterized protein YbjT (DUF2867 family)